MYRNTNNRVRSIYGAYDTRKWNDDVNIHYFQKVRGGKYFLSKCLEESKEKQMVFNSSLISDNEKNLWSSAGWVTSHKLRIYSMFFSNPRKTGFHNKRFEFENLVRDHFEDLVSIDKEIFRPYWRSSNLSLLDTLRSSNKTILYTYPGRGESLQAYALVGLTMRSSFLQRFAVHPDIQGLGYGSLLLENIIEDMYQLKMISMKLNTQEDNYIAQKLYENKGFSLSTRNLSIMST